MRPITSSIDGGETSSAEDGISRPTPLPSKQLVAAAAYLACTLTAQVAYNGACKASKPHTQSDNTIVNRFTSSNMWILIEHCQDSVCSVVKTMVRVQSLCLSHCAIVHACYHKCQTSKTSLSLAAAQSWHRLTELCTQAAHTQRVHVELGEVSVEEAHLSSVIELMLDITESSVAFCWELGAGNFCWWICFDSHAVVGLE